MKVSSVCRTRQGRVQPMYPQHLVQVLSAIVVAVAFSHFLQRQVGATPDETTSRPNIILVMADDLGWGDTGYGGHPVLKTPNLDAMARAGLQFNRFYSAAPVCSPTRGSCLTGRHPYRYGIYFANTGHLPPDELTLAELLKEQGYVTGHFGKWHLGTLTKTIKESNRGGPRGAKHYAPPWEHGFDVCLSTEAKVPTWDPLLRPVNVARRTWWDPVVEAVNSKSYGTHYWRNGELVVDPLRGDDSRVIMDDAIPFIAKAAAQKKPFLAVIWFHAPHLPVVAGRDYTAKYAQEDKYTQHYYGCITALDEQIGRLRKRLRELDVAKQTMVWFCSDNGPEGNDRAPGSTGGLRGRKRSLFEGGVRVPGICEWPARIEANRVADFPASTSDYLPTILDALQLQMPDARPLDGVSLLPLIDGRMKERPRPMGFQSRGPAALIDNRYKLIYPAVQRSGGRKKGQGTDAAPRGPMLFDLVEDPAESRDLSSSRSDIVASMSATLTAWQASCKTSNEGGDYQKVRENEKK